jgi:large subunit ribosomal protein L9
MAKNIELLLLKSIENLGIVGDIVKVKPGFARNYLLPLGFAETPTPTRIEALKEERAKAQAELAALRSAREELLSRMNSIEITLVRSCNDQGVLYGSVTQRDISDALQENGFDVGTRSVRLSQPIRRVGSYDVPIQFEKDLRTDVHVKIDPDQPLDERDELEIDDEGELVEKKAKPAKSAKKDAPADTADAPAPAEA